MKKVSIFAFLVLCGSLLAIAGGSTASPPASTAAALPAALPNSVPVSVVNTPLPVQGTVNANINNPSFTVTGTVGVSSLPPVTLGGTSAVSLSNTKTTPVFVDTDNEARAGIGAQCFAPFDATGTANCLLATVPAGQTLVIETITCTAGVATGSLVVPGVLTMAGAPIGGGGSVNLNHSLFFTKVGTAGTIDYYSLMSPVKMYAAAAWGGNTGVYLSVQVGASTANVGNAACAISGHMVTL